MATMAGQRTDGRVQRSERSREAIVVAMLELIGEGSLTPTAQQVAERADVGVRTVFRHFSDMETLYAAINERFSESAAGLFVSEIQTGPLADRVDGLLRNRIHALEQVGPYMRAAAIQRWRSDFLSQQHERNVRRLRRDLQKWLPEVEAAPAELADALEMALSFEAWSRLRVDQKLGNRRATQALRRTVEALCRELPKSATA